MNGLACILCGQPVDLFELDEQGYSGEPAHRVCADAARQAFSEACDMIAEKHRRLNDRLGRRYERFDAA